MIKNKRVLVTRAQHQADEMLQALQEVGAIPVHTPLIETVSLLTEQALKKVMQEVASYQWLVFTSANGVHTFFEAVRHWSPNMQESLAQKCFAVVGEKTAHTLHAHGYTAQVMPPMNQAHQEGLLESILKVVPQQENILLCQGNLARSDLQRGLEDAGYQVQAVKIYETRDTNLSADTFCAMLQEQPIDIITFTSSSTCRHFDRLIKQCQLSAKNNHWLIASIGPQTTKTLRELGYQVHIEANTYSVEGLIQAIIQYYQGLK